MADGNIRIKTELNNEGIPKDLAELKKMVADGSEDVGEEFAQKVSELSNKWSGLKQKQEENNNALDDYKYKLEEVKNLTKEIPKIKQGMEDNQVQQANIKDKFNAGDITFEQAQNQSNALAMDFEMMRQDSEYIDKKLKELPSQVKLEESIARAEQKASDLSVKMDKVSVDASKFKSKLDESVEPSSKLSNNIQTVNRESNNFNKTMAGGARSMAKYGLALLSIRSVYQMLKGLSNEWLNSNTAAANQTKADLEAIKGTLANAIAPVVQWLVGILKTVVGYLGTIIKVFTGVNIFASGTSKSLAKSAKSAKEIRKQLAGFDEMNVMSADKEDSSDGGGGGSVPVDFDTTGMDAFASKLQGWVDHLLKELQPFIDTIKSIDWQPMIDGLNNVKRAGMDTFKILGDSIIRVMNDSMGPFIKMMAEDIIPQGLNTVAKIIDRLNPAIDRLLKDFVEPLIGWFLLDFVPVGLNLVFSILDFIGAVLTVLIESFTTFWNLVGKPIAMVAWELLKGVLEGLKNVIDFLTVGLDAFLEDLRAGDPLATALATGIGLIVTGLLAYKVAQLAVNIATAAFGALQAVNPFAWVVLAIVAIIAIVYALREHWDEITAFFKQTIADIKQWFIELGAKIDSIWQGIKDFIYSVWDGIKQKCKEMIQGIKDAWQGFKDWIFGIGKSIGDTFSNIWGNIKQGASDAWEGIKNTFATVASFFGNIFGNAWEGVKNIFSTGGKIFDGIKEGIVSAFSAIVNAIIDGINRVVSVPFNGINWALNKLRNVSILGAHPFGWMATIDVPQIPRLAKGGIANASTFAEIGEQGKEAVVPLQNNTEWARDFLDVLDSYGGGFGNTGDNIINVIVDGEIVQTVVQKRNKDQNFRNNGRRLAYD